MAAEDAGDAITDGLKKKVGPLPVGVWIIAGGAGIAIAMYMRRQSAATDVTPADPESQDFNLGGNTDTPPGAGNLGAGGNTTPAVPTAPADNDEWFKRAVDLLVIRGGSGATINAALGKFLNGESLGQSDRAIVDTAILLLGNPPTQPPPAPNAPPVPPRVPPRDVPPMPGTPGKIAKPGPPVRPHLVTLVPGRATVAVTAVPRATSYRWFLNGELANSTPGTSVTLTGIVKGHNYTVGVQPQNSAGNGPESGGLSFKGK